MDSQLAPVSKDSALIPQYEQIENSFSTAFRLVDDVVLKNYITRLPELRVIPIDDAQL